MLDYQVRGINLDVTESIDTYIQRKLERLERYLDADTDYTGMVTLRVNKDKSFTVEVTIQLPYLLLRAEDTDDDFYKAVDMTSDKLERQVRKFKTRVNRKSREKGVRGLKESAIIEDAQLHDEMEEAGELNVVRRKTIDLQPMDEEEAALQMELLDHNFFLFLDMNTNRPTIIYRRRDGEYALLDTND